MKARILVLVMLLSAWVPARAQDDFLKVDLRVISSKPVVVDRGSGDGLVVGDVVRFFTRQGNTYRGTVTQLDQRSSVVELMDRSYVPAPGTRAEVRIPRTRLGPIPEEDEEEREQVPAPPPAEREQEPEQEKEPEVAGKHDWKNQDEDWEPGMPLLAEVKPVRPEERPVHVYGRIYTGGHATFTSEDGRSDSFLDTGADVTYSNPFGHGGELRMAGDVSYRNLNRPDETNENERHVRLDRFSYAQGGTRFDPTRWEVGRFLQRGMPEFGVVDGYEWGRRRANGDRYGVSLGFMPERDYEYHTGDDFQLAAYYEWVAGHSEDLTFATGFQKTLHNGDGDRDLLVTKLHYVPIDAWNYHATLWVDFYTGKDDAKNSSIEVTQAIASANRRWNNGNGLDLTYTRIRFPDIDRAGEFVPPATPQEIQRNRNDRLALSGWTWAGDHLRLHGVLGGWNDEDGSGGDAAFGFEIPGAVGRGSSLDLTGFGTSGQFENSLGARMSLSRSTAGGRWDLSYEFANHRQDGFSADFNDIGQHILRASRDWYTLSGWTFSLYGQGAYWDEEGSFTAGFYLQKVF